MKYRPRISGDGRSGESREVLDMARHQYIKPPVYLYGK
jgi:hypothetical protein